MTWKIFQILDRISRTISKNSYKQEKLKVLKRWKENQVKNNKKLPKMM